MEGWWMKKKSGHAIEGKKIEKKSSEKARYIENTK